MRLYRYISSVPCKLGGQAPTERFKGGAHSAVAGINTRECEGIEVGGKIMVKYKFLLIVRGELLNCCV